MKLTVGSPQMVLLVEEVSFQLDECSYEVMLGFVKCIFMSIEMITKNISHFTNMIYVSLIYILFLNIETIFAFLK